MAKEKRYKIEVYLLSGESPIVIMDRWSGYMSEDKFNDPRNDFIEIGGNIFRKSHISRVLVNEVEVGVPDKEKDGGNQQTAQ